MLLLSFLALLTGVFVFKKLWLGAMAAVIIYLIFKISMHASFDTITVPLSSGFLISFELTLLLFGAFLFYNILSSNNHFNDFNNITSAFSSKLSIVIILCLFMGSFMEGIAGFGIPTMLIAPLMLVVGFKPLTSIVLPLAANTIAVTFGALGTPLKIGLGINTSDETVLLTLLLNSLPALTLPFIMAFLYGKTEQLKIDWRKEWKILLGAGFCYLIPYLSTGYFSIEYPSVVAGVFGLISFVFFFIPKKENPSLTFWWNTFYPYLLFVFLLVIAKYYLGDYAWKIKEPLKPISFYQPGVVFILTGILYLFLIKKRQLVLALFHQSKTTVFKIAKPILTIVFLVCFTQLIQQDVSGIAHRYYSDLSKTVQVFITPVMGVSGSFITGSASMSNLLLSNGVRSSNTNLPLLLALLNTGSAIGNAISLQNIVMVKSIINYPIRIEKVLQYNLVVIGFYLALTIAVSFIFL
ncbi:MAG: L-lactate permease [Chitinophagaceae bacterium]|nr:L-lactate permease [Chitinophagaceae bacterium]